MYALLALLISCQQPECYDIKPSECEGDLCDITAPLKDAISSCESNPPIADNHISRNRVGCRFELPAGRLVLSETVELCRQHDIVGKGGNFWGARTRLETLGGYTGIWLRYFTECNAEGKGGGSGGSIISDLALYSPLGTSTTTPSYGILVESARVTLKRLWIRGFVQGIRISADHTRPKPTNANLPTVDHVTVDVNEHSGIFIQGGDSNAGLLSLPNVHSNCWFANRWTSQLGVCANIHDRSFLGNTIVAGHTSFCKDAETGDICEGYRFSNNSQRSVCVGCYAEKNQLAGSLSQSSNAIGGIPGQGWVGKGSYFFGSRINRLIVINNGGTPTDITDDVQVEMGMASNLVGVAFQIRAFAFQTGSWPLALHVNKEGGFYSLRLANSESYSVMRIYGVHHPDAYLGGFHLLPKDDRYLFGRFKKLICPLTGSLCD